MRVMRADNSWHIPASKYHELYNRLYIEGYVYGNQADNRSSYLQSFEPAIPLDISSDYLESEKEVPYAH